MNAIFFTFFFIHPAMSGDISQTLINGTPADTKDFPASVYANSGGGSCTATVVGEKALIIASHCVSHGATAQFSVGANQYTAKCSQSPLYRQGTDHDIALCKIDKAVTGIKYESINTDPNLYDVGSKLQLTGYGCVTSEGTGGNDGIYRIGESPVKRMPSPQNNSWDIVTEGGGALCFGDSGGPAFFYKTKNERYLVSVNSKGDIEKTSYLTSTTTPDSEDFIIDWSSENSVSICGVHDDAENCAIKKETPPEDQPEENIAEACKELSGALDTWGTCMNTETPSLKDCDNANDLLQKCYATK